MKRLILIVSTLCVLGSLAQAQNTVLTVDMGAVFEGIDEAKAKRNELEDARQKLEDEVLEMQASGQEKVDEYQTLQEQLNNPMLAPERKLEIEEEASQLEQDILTRRQELQDFVQTNREELTQRGRLLLETYYKKIQIAVADIAKEKGALIVLNSTGEFNAAVIYHTDTVDITSTVIDTINRETAAAN
ncbi:MAG: OmpH family outer membrane protein [Opitutales bacterium]